MEEDLNLWKKTIEEDFFLDKKCS